MFVSNKKYIGLVVLYIFYNFLGLWKSFPFLFAVARRGLQQMCRKSHLSVIPVSFILDMHVKN